MRPQKKPIRSFLWALALGFGLLWCIPVSSPAAQENPSPVSLKVALLPIFDSLPFYVAQAQGFLENDFFAVTAVQVNSALERDQLMQAGVLDAMLSEMPTTANFNRRDHQVQILLTARAAQRGQPLFRIVAAPGSRLESPAQLAGVAVGISTNTIIEYVTDRLLAASGLGNDQIVKRSVPVIPERYQLLMQGRLRAATLPDPLAQSALAAGAVAVVDDGAHPRYSASVLCFRTAAVASKADAVRFFLGAWDRAAALINANPDQYRALLLEKIRVPANVRTTFRMPTFPRGRVPSREQWQDVMQWMVARGLLPTALPYQPSVNTAFLPPAAGQ